VPLAAWFRRHGADVMLVPPERSADLRRYYVKHTKSDWLDSQLLAQLPMLHPNGLARRDRCRSANRIALRFLATRYADPHV
jgi:hypothetical protein